MTRVVISGPLVGERPTGQGVHLTQLVRAMLNLDEQLEVISYHATLRRGDEHRVSVEKIDARLARRTARAPASVLWPVQRWTRLPRDSWLTGAYDVYHQFQTATSPAVRRRRLVVTCHDLVELSWPEEEGRLPPGTGRLLRRAAAVVTVSRYSAETIGATFDIPAERIHVVPNGVDHRRFAPDRTSDGGPTRQRFSGGAPYLLYVGGRTPRKNIGRILDAFHAAEQGDPGLRLLLAGTAGMGHLPELFCRPQLEGKVIQLGFLDDIRLVEVLRAAECLVFPSLEEGFGIPVLEAMACGTPVVTSSRSALPEVAGGAAVLVDPLSTEAVVGGIQQVLSMAEQDLAAMRTRGIAHALTFDWSRSARAMLDVYASLL